MADQTATLDNLSIIFDGDAGIVDADAAGRLTTALDPRFPFDTGFVHSGAALNLQQMFLSGASGLFAETAFSGLSREFFGFAGERRRRRDQQDLTIQTAIEAGNAGQSSLMKSVVDKVTDAVSDYATQERIRAALGLFLGDDIADAEMDAHVQEIKETLKALGIEIHDDGPVFGRATPDAFKDNQDSITGAARTAGTVPEGLKDTGPDINNPALE